MDPLAGARTIYLIDWPSRDVPESLARAGLTVVSNDGPDEYNAYEAHGSEVRQRPLDGPPAQADVVYTHRPLDELPEIVEAAKSMRARLVWLQSGRDSAGAKDARGCWLPDDESRRARDIVENAGLTYIESPYIGDALGSAVTGVAAPCIFCEIVAGRSAKHLVYEDERTLSFLSITPAARGHTLVVPKRHARNVFDVANEDLAAVALAGQVVALRLRERLRCDGLSWIQSNEPAGWQTVFHYHLHVVPRHSGDRLTPPWPGSGLAGTSDLAEVAAQLR